MRSELLAEDWVVVWSIPKRCRRLPYLTYGRPGTLNVGLAMKGTQRVDLALTVGSSALIVQRRNLSQFVSIDLDALDP